MVEKKSAESSAAGTQIDKAGLIRSHMSIAAVVIGLLVYGFRHTELITYLATMEELFISAGYYMKKEVLPEAMVNGLGWSIMHLLLRRMMNPENSNYKWFDGYFLDSCYRGMAAAGQTLFKGFFMATLLRKS